MFGWCPRRGVATQDPVPLDWHIQKPKLGPYKRGDMEHAQLFTLKWQPGSGPLETGHRHGHTGGEAGPWSWGGAAVCVLRAQEKSCPCF